MSLPAQISASLPTPEARAKPIEFLMKTGQYSQALGLLLPKVQAEPPALDVLHAVADCYWGMDMTERCFLVLDAVADTWPEHLETWHKIGTRKLALGDRAAASAAFHKMLDLDPVSAMALSSLHLADPLAADSAEAAKLRQLAGSPLLSVEETACVCNALGQIEGAAGNTRQAMQYFRKCKDAIPGTYSPAEFDQRIAEQRAAFHPGATPEALTGDGAPRFAFVTGLPRSGTTLLDVMLSRHPDIASIGESPGLADARLAAHSLMKKQAADPGFWQWCQEAPVALLSAVRNAFLQNNVPAEPAGASVIVDKMPANALEMGFARMILPEARFIFMMRHPLDVGLSLFTRNFANGQLFSKRLEWIGHMIRTVYASLDDFQPKLGSRLRVQSYRALVEAPEPQMRAILAHLEMDWNPACLSPEASDQAVKTASVMQVRKGINRKGLDKWKPYEAELAPLIAALGGWKWIREWEARDAAAAAADA
ncbi:tetratricopeptide repeat-containing sulfotransferase family protein [Cribrihabitans pelagius]